MILPHYLADILKELSTQSELSSNLQIFIENLLSKDEKRYSETLEQLKQKSNRNSNESFLLACCYLLQGTQKEGDVKFEYTYKNEDKLFKYSGDALASIEQALQILESIKSQSSAACCLLGMMYKSALGVKRDRKKAFEYDQLAANQGSMLVYKDIECYLSYQACATDKEYISAYPTGDKRDINQLRKLHEEWIIKGAEAGDFDSMLTIAARCRNGTDGFQKDIKRAIEWYEKAATLGSSEACIHLWSICNGNASTKSEQSGLDTKRAQEWLQLAEKHAARETDERVYRTKQLLLSYDVRLALTWYEKEVNKGSAQAASAIANLYLQGYNPQEYSSTTILSGTEESKDSKDTKDVKDNKDTKESKEKRENKLLKDEDLYLKWMEKAVELGDMQSAESLGNYYIKKAESRRMKAFGFGPENERLAEQHQMDREYRVALKWFLKAYTLGDTLPARDRYEKPWKEHCINNIKERLQTLHKQFSEGAAKIAVKDPRYAFEWFQRTAYYGDKQALTSLAGMYAKDLGCCPRSTDISKLNHNKPRAVIIAVLYASIKGYYPHLGLDNLEPFLKDFSVSIDKQTFENYISVDKLSSLQNDPVAYSILGFCYHFGLGVARDLKRAAEYYRLAIDLGYFPCVEDLRACHQIDPTVVSLDEILQGYKEWQEYLDSKWKKSLEDAKGAQDAQTLGKLAGDVSEQQAWVKNSLARLSSYPNQSQDLHKALSRYGEATQSKALLVQFNKLQSVIADAYQGHDSSIISIITDYALVAEGMPEELLHVSDQEIFCEVLESSFKRPLDVKRIP